MGVALYNASANSWRICNAGDLRLRLGTAASKTVHMMQILGKMALARRANVDALPSPLASTKAPRAQVAANEPWTTSSIRFRYDAKKGPLINVRTIAKERPKPMIIWLMLSGTDGTNAKSAACNLTNRSKWDHAAVYFRTLSSELIQSD
ncbi:unnamed protein product [Prorocentrum cordatum]|uniref:Uncharacterized protein n=1 Tax=Prorocentrum cordatum TaxID=2364126 RepID=A0ABN9VAD0_9DINO|nr:unnamed protein product [Polarella glacialis]